VRVGLIADLHGNLPALEAVLAELEREGVDELVCLGDVAVGPQPGATLERVRSLGCPVVLGNWDAWFLDGFPQLEGELNEKLLEMGAWWASQLSDVERDYVRGFRPAHEVSLGNGASLLCFHGSPRSYDDMILATTPDDELEPMLAGAADTVLAGGHTHLPLLRRHGGSLLVNPGSVGLPFRHQPGPIRIARWAEYGVVIGDGGSIAVELRRTPYDVAAFLDLARSSGAPHADWWVGCWADG
jgi:putative phosphoesterase